MSSPRISIAANNPVRLACWLALLALVALLPVSLRAQMELPPPSTQFGTLIVRQNDNLNTSTSITMFRGPGGTLRWEPVPFASSRADFGISFLNENDFTSGALISSVAENGRNNNAFGDTIGQFYATTSVATAGGVDPPVAYFFATARAAQGSEVNVNLSFGYFPYDLWLGGTGWISDRGNGLPLDRFNGSPSLALGSNLIDIGSGVTLLDLRSADPTATPANGVLLVNHAKNEDNYAASAAQADGTWRIGVRDNGSNGTGTEQDPVTFVYFPVSKVGTERLQALGRVNSDATTDVAGGDFSVTKGPTGQWFLKIPGGSPDTGTLIISAEGGATNNSDNIVSFQWDPVNARWIIESRDIVSATALPVLENGATAGEDMFSFVFFSAPILPDILVTSPTEGQIFTSPASFTVTADASDFNGNVAQVEFFRNGAFIGIDTTEPYTIEETGLDGGRYIYVARATDNDGLAPTSTPVTAVVRTDPLNPPLQTALFFDGLVEHVATNPSPQLGVGGPPTKGMTLEAWFRKEGLGATAGSGSGGITVQPLFAKGRGESDNNNTDTNYLVGVTQDGFLAADFEAFPTSGVVAGGANFPIFGTHEPIQDGRWYHAAVTYDGEKGEWKLFLDGVQVAARTTLPGVMPRYDSNHRFAIGAALNTAGQRAGSFFGAIDEVRVWDYARSPEDIAATKDSSVVSAAGLVGRFGLDEGTGAAVASSVDSLTGEVRGPVDGDGLPVVGWQPLWVPGAPLTNQAPSLTLHTPKANQVFRSATPILISATAGDLDGSVVKVEFFDGETELQEFAPTSGSYQFLWSGGTPGVHVIRAVATDDKGSVAAQMVNITLVAPSELVLTELHSNPSATAPAGVGDYWELTNFGSTAKVLDGYTWHDSGRNRAAALAWALPEGTSLAPGESVVFTAAAPEVFRAWWGLPPTARVLQSVGSPGLGVNDGVVLYDNTGAEVFYFSYAAGGFTRSNGLPSLGGHAGASAGGLATEALVWDPNSGRGLPRYMAASNGVNGSVGASTGTDVGSPGGSFGSGIDPATLLLLQVAPASFSEGAGAAAAVGTLQRYGNAEADLTVQLVSGDTTEATVPVSVVIPAGQSSVTFDVAAVNDALADGTQQVLMAGTAPGVSLATTIASIQDDGDIAPPTLFITEIHSSPSDALGAADYWELTNYGTSVLDLSGFTWDDESRLYVEGQAWAFPNGTSIAAGESIIITTADPAAFRTWWGLEPTVQVIQTVGAPGLGQNDGIALFDNTGRELFYFSYAAQSFLRPDGSGALGGHAGVSGGGATTDALVWDVPSGLQSPRYVAAEVGLYQAFQAPGATDIGSPGRGAATVPVSFTLQVLHVGDAQAGLLAPQTAPNVAALVDAF
ncbi:Ig-like domain-containing protein, partial [Prosthecobacter dejongeii]